MNWPTLLLALWPLWLVMAVCVAVWLACRFGYMAPDSYEDPEPCGCGFGCCCGFCSCCPSIEEQRRYHEGNGWGR